jgi:hypothetical protein
VIEGMDLSTSIEQQLVNEFRNTDLSKVPEGHFFELQDRLLHSLKTYYNSTAEIQFSSEKRPPVARTHNYDTPAIDPEYYLDIFKKSRLLVYSLSSNEPSLIRAILRKRTPVLIFGDFFYNRFSNDSEKRLFRRHQSFDVLIGYSLLKGAKSNLPGEEGDQYLYQTRTGFSFTSYDDKELLGRALNLYNVVNDSRWILSKVYVILPDTISATDYVAELKKDNDLKIFTLKMVE